uniref:DUF389 domain-containing protein n=1 Tax=Graphocephala atropunctata TaxID=36148 RepID=A0A1B6KVF1_9HEMI
MGSLYVMITVPSAEHEKSLWLEKSLGIQKNEKTISFSIRPNRGPFDMADDNFKPSSRVLNRSLSNDSLMDKVTSELQAHKERSHSDTHMPNIKNRTPMEKRLEKCLKELKIPNAVWVLGSKGKYHQVSFCTPAGEQCELIVQLLTEHEIGVELNSTVSILPCSLYYEGKGHNLPNTASTFPTSQKYVKELTAWERFIHSVRDRLMVAQVVAGVKNNAVFTFDFLILLIIASFTAAVGLVENSVVVLVASMLISPLMGPVMASIFGFVTKDWKLQKIGVLNEFLGLLLCVLIGFLYGIIIACFSWESPDVPMWPTPEMLNRGDLRSLWVGALIALMSGAAVAIAVLGDYSGSLTGVAISASLMPPAVNAGLLWATAAVAILYGDLECQRLSALRSEEPVKQLLLLGALSLALTFINIVCIFIMGIIVLKIKEVTPRGSKDYSKFLWKETIQMAQDYQYRFSQSADRMEEGYLPNSQPDLMSEHPNRFGLNQYTWSAYGAFQDFNRPSICDLVSAWQQMSVNPSTTETHQHHRRVKGILRGTPSPHPNASNLTRLWSVMSSPATCYLSFSDSGSPLPTPKPRSSLRPHNKFVVTPADVHSISD